MELPNVDAYAAALPEGWSSFPQCGVRASLVAGLRDRGVFDAVTGLPPEVERGIRSAGTTGDWYPEVLHVAGLLAVRDAQFPGPDGDAGYLAWMDQLNRELMTVPGQPGAFAAATTDDLVARTPAIWSAIHRGSDLALDRREPTLAWMTLTYPKQLFVRLSLEATRRAFAAGLARAGAAQPVVTFDVEVDGDLAHARFRSSW